MDATTLSLYSSVAATPFGLLPEPLRWEFLFAVQQRDLSGRAALVPIDVRGTYLAFRRAGLTSVVGAVDFARQRVDSNVTGMIVDWQRIVDEAYREWSGVDDRNPRLIYLQDLRLRKTTKPIGPNARMDLRAIEQDWIFQSVAAWTRDAPRGFTELGHIQGAWVLADEILRVRGTPRRALGLADMTAIIDAIRARWKNERTQAR